MSPVQRRDDETFQALFWKILVTSFPPSVLNCFLMKIVHISKIYDENRILKNETESLMKELDDEKKVDCKFSEKNIYARLYRLKYFKKLEYVEDMHKNYQQVCIQLILVCYSFLIIRYLMVFKLHQSFETQKWICNT